MSKFDRRAFMQTAALGTMLTSVLAASSAKAAGSGDYYVIAEIVAKPGSADALRARPVRSPKNRATNRAVSFIHCLKLNWSPGVS